MTGRGGAEIGQHDKSAKPATPDDGASQSRRRNKKNKI